MTDDGEQFGSATLTGLERQIAEERKLEQQAERWRDEVSSRIATYKEKRSRKQLAGEFSMRFDFETSPYSPRAAQAAAAAARAWEDEAQNEADAHHVPELGSSPSMMNIAIPEPDDVLAASAMLLDALQQSCEPAAAPPSPIPPASVIATPPAEALDAPAAPQPPARRARRSNLIAFPRLPFMPPPPDELAEPVLDTPRILDVPDEIVQEVVGDRTPLADIALESDADEIASRPEFDVPLQVAPLALRFAAALIDGVVVLVATALFAFVAQTLAPAIPRNRMALAVSVGAPLLLFAVYQYAFLVYGLATVGMRAARLEIRRFDDAAASAGRRRLRALAMVLSFASLGLGIFWAFADEDMLCWHDRITRTYLAKK